MTIFCWGPKSVLVWSLDVVIQGKTLKTQYCQCNSITNDREWWCKPPAFHELLHVIKNVLNTKQLGFMLESCWDASKPSKIISEILIMLENPWGKKSVSSYTVCSRCIIFLAVENAEKYDVIKFRSWVGSLIRGCEGSYVCNPTVEKHVNFCWHSTHGKSLQHGSHHYRK